MTSTPERLAALSMDVTVLRERMVPITAAVTELDGRVGALERWRWQLVGIGTGIGATVSSVISLLAAGLFGLFG